MRIYKELIFEGDKSVLDHLNSSIYEVFPKTWIKPKDSYLLKDYIVADYVGNAVPRAEVSIYYGSDTWRKGSDESRKYCSTGKRSAYHRRI